MDLMTILKTLFGSEALTFEQFAEKLNGAENLKLGNLADGKYVDKNKYEDLSKQLEAANKNLADYDPEWKSKLKQAQADGEKKLNDYKFNQSLEKAIADSGAADVVSVKANLDMSTVAPGEDGAISGLSEQLESLKTAKPFLFKSEEPEPKLNLGGSTAGTKSGQIKKDISDMSYEEYKEYRKTL